MPSGVINNKRIAKNTMLLYVRTLLVLIISLYTSRIILQSLGVEDFGIYQVVGGMIGMFSIISNALSSAISRFITYGIGIGDKRKLKLILSSSKIIQISISALVFIVSEIVGPWLLRTHMQIPEGRLIAAEWVLQCTIFSFCISIINVPYTACLIAHEHMRTFAFFNIAEVAAKLGVCYLIIVSPFDQLISYAVLLALITLLTQIGYVVFCRLHFEESRARLIFKPSIFKEIAGFAGWSFFTNTTYLFNTQGVNMLLNVFFGVTANAARGIANQVESAVMSFVNNFTTAVNPQITKSFAAGEMQGMYTLVCRGAKFSYFAMLFMAVPLIIETETVLRIWLTVVPPHTATFVRLSLVLGMLDCLGNSSYTACLATGKMRKYALIITPIGCLEFPLAWIAFCLGAPIATAYYLYIVVKMLVLVARLYLIRTMLGFNPFVFVKNVYLRVFPVTVLSFIFPLLPIFFFPPSLFRLLITTMAGILSVGICSLYIGMTSRERSMILGTAYEWIKRKNALDWQLSNRSL